MSEEIIDKRINLVRFEYEFIHQLNGRVNVKRHQIITEINCDGVTEYLIDDNETLEYHNLDHALESTEQNDDITHLMRKYKIQKVKPESIKNIVKVMKANYITPAEITECFED